MDQPTASVEDDSGTNVPTLNAASDDAKRPVVQSRHRIDTGWAWVVDAGAFVTLMIFMGVQRSYGIFYVELQEKFQVSASAVSLIGSTVSATFSLGALFVLGFFLNVLSARQCILIGVSIMTSAITLSTLATSFAVFIFTLGALSGISMSLIYGPMFVVLGRYFNRRLALAQAIANTGVSVGALVMPMVIRVILDHYSFPSGLLMVGGMACHMFVCAFLFRPVSDEDLAGALRDPKMEQQTKEDRKAQTNAENDYSKDQCSTMNEADQGKRNHTTSEGSESRPDKLTPGTLEESSATPLRTRTSSESEKNKVLGGTAFTNGRHERRVQLSESSRVSKNLDPLHNRHSTEHVTSSEGETNPSGQASRVFLDKLSSSAMSIDKLTTTPETLCASLVELSHSHPSVHGHLGKDSNREDHSSARGKKTRWWKSDKLATLCNADACTHLPTWGLVVYQLFGLLVGVLGPAFLPPLAKEFGLTDNEAAFLLTLLGGLDIVSRLLPGIVVHIGLLKPHQMVIISLTLQGILCQFLRFFRSYRAMVGFCVGFGCLSGVFFTLTQAVVVEYVGLQRFPLAFGFIQLFNGLSAALAYPITGALKDVTGTYVTSFHYLGATELVSAAVLASLPLLCRLQEKLDARRVPRSDEETYKDEETDKDEATSNDEVAVPFLSED